MLRATIHTRMLACQSATPISGARNSGLPGSTARGAGHDRWNSLVGAGLLHSTVVAKNCRDRRQTRRTRFSRRNAFFRWEGILPYLATLPRCASTTASGNQLNQIETGNVQASPSRQKPHSLTKCRPRLLAASRLQTGPVGFSNNRSVIFCGRTWPRKNCSWSRRRTQASRGKRTNR